MLVKVFGTNCAIFGFVLFCAESAEKVFDLTFRKLFNDPRRDLILNKLSALKRQEIYNLGLYGN